MKEIRRNNRIIRATIQVGFFILSSGAWAAAFGGVRYIFTQIHLLEPILVNDFLKMLLALIVATIFMGRFFCGYGCAFGTLGDGIYGLSYLFQKKVLKRKKVFSFSERTIISTQKAKYVVLVFIAVVCLTGNYAKVAGWDPWGPFSMIVSGKFQFDGMAIGVIIGCLILVGMALMERFFCQVLCPMGAVFAILPIIPIGGLRRDRPNCIKGCRLCEINCPVKLEVDLTNNKYGECIKCGRCVDVCPKKHITFGIKSIKPTSIGAVVIQTGVLAAIIIAATYI